MVSITVHNPQPLVAALKKLMMQMRLHNLLKVICQLKHVPRKLLMQGTFQASLFYCSGVLRVVTLFPKETCSCPSTGQCYHLLAVRLCVGMTELKKKTRHNLTQLRKNTRSKKEVGRDHHQMSIQQVESIDTTN